MTELPLTLQEELLLLSGGQFVKKNTGTSISSNFWTTEELTVLKHHDGYQLFQDGVFLLDLPVGEKRRFSNASRMRGKGWVEVGGVYRCVKKFEGVYDWVKRMGWRMTGITLTFEEDSSVNGSFYHEEVEFEKKVKIEGNRTF